LAASLPASVASTGSLGRRVGERGPNPVPAAKQVIVVDPVLVAERNAEHPLRHHRRDRVLDLRRGAVVDQTRREPCPQTDRPIGRAEQQAASL
jgi:hypothetical protein